MKKYFTLLFLGLGLTSYAQTNPNAISLYVDMNVEAEYFTFYGLSYQRFLAPNHGLQVYTGFSWQENYSLGVDYTYNRNILSEYLSVFAGVGVGMEHHSENSILGVNNYYLFRPQLGLGFQIPTTNFGIFGAYKPKFDLKTYDTFDSSSITFGVKYNF